MAENGLDVLVHGVPGQAKARGDLFVAVAFEQAALGLWNWVAVEFWYTSSLLAPAPTLPTKEEVESSGQQFSSRQAALNAVLADLSSTTEFAEQIARILDEGPAKEPLHRVGLPTNNDQDDIWSSIRGIDEMDKISGQTMEFGRNNGRG